MVVAARDGTVTFERFFIDEYPRLVPMLHAWTGDRQRAEDDALTLTVFTAFAEPSAEGGLVVTATRAVDVCGRGITTFDGVTGCV